jgi:hypothetical protein
MVIKVNPLKTSDIERAIKELQDYKRKLVSSFCHSYMEAMGNRFDEILNEEAPPEAMGLWSKGEVEDGENGAKVTFTFAGETEFIEFGTGIIGKENHDGANMEWADKLPPPYTGYETNLGITIDPKTHIWWYWNGSGLTPTRGRIADPFIYRSTERLIEESVEIAKRVMRMIEHGNGQEQ